MTTEPDYTWALPIAAERKADIQPKTPLPWEIEKCRCGHKSCDQWAFGNQGSVGFYGDDARYAVHACNAYPAAAARIEALTAEVERLRGAVQVLTPEPYPTKATHTCKHYGDNCQEHNLHCGWPECAIARAALKDTRHAD